MVETVKTEKKEVTPVKKQVARRNTRKKFNINKEFLCKNITSSKLTYRSRKTGYEVTWNSYGDEQWVDGKELVDMNSSQPTFTHTPWIFIEDEDLIKHLGISKIYEQAKLVVDINQIFNMTPTEIDNIVGKMSKDLQEVVFVKTREAIRNDELKDFGVIRRLSKVLNKDLVNIE